MVQNAYDPSIGRLEQKKPKCESCLDCKATRCLKQRQNHIAYFNTMNESLVVLSGIEQGMTVLSVTQSNKIPANTDEFAAKPASKDWRVSWSKVPKV